jgi:hypothetical protein
MMLLRKIIVSFSILLISCSTSGPISMQILQKENGKIHYAIWKGRTFSNAGFIEINLGDKTYRGEPAKVNESNLFGLKSKFGNYSRISSNTSLLTNYYRALLANEDGIGMRCDFYLDLSSGSGLCLDENGKQYEISLLF